MVVFGVEFADSSVISRVDLEILNNASKPFAQTTFIVKTSRLDNKILIVYKEFVAEQVMKWLYLFLGCGAMIPFFIWGVTLPLWIVAGLSLIWSFLNTPAFNFLMFKIMVKRLGYRGKLRLL